MTAGSRALFSQVDCEIAISLDSRTQISILKQRVGTGDIGKRFVFPASGIAGSAIALLTNGRADLVWIFTRGYPVSGRAGHGNPEAARFRFSHCGGPVDFERATIDEVEIRIDSFTYNQRPTVPWTDYTLNTTVTLRGRCFPVFETYGRGCTGTGGVPTLTASSGGPSLGQAYSMQVTNLPPSIFSAPFMLVGDSRSRWGSTPLPLDLAPFGMSGCELHVNPILTQPLVNLGGVATWTVQIPNSQSLLGKEFFNQAIVLDRTANAAGVVFSDGARSIPGS